MKNYGRLSVVGGLLVGCCLGASVAQAVVVPAAGGGATLAIRDTNNVDLPDGNVNLPNGAFPKPQQILQLVLTVGGTTTPITSLTVQAATTAHKGTCTNSGLPTDTSPDFEPVSGRFDQIRSLDCGGTAVVLVNNAYTFTFPADSDGDRIPDWYEQLYCGTTTCLQPMGDIEHIGANVNDGDGFVNLDEYRGFIITGVPTRTNPLRKDLFVHLVNPEGTCARLGTLPALAAPEGTSFLGTSSVAAADQAKVFPTDGTGLFATVTFTGVDTHFLNFVPRGINNASETEWVDNLSGLTGASKDQRVYVNGTDGPVSDRRVNVNTLDPGNTTLKGIRIIECLDESVNSPIGLATFPTGVVVGTPAADTNSIIYTQRIYNDYAALMTRASTQGATSAYQSCAGPASTQTCVYYQTYVHSGATVTPTTATKVYTPAAGFTCLGGGTSCSIKRDYITSKYIQYVTAMELGHSLSLIPVLQIAQYGAHYAEGSGDNLDQRVVVKDSSKLKGVLFSIPSAYGYRSNDCFQLKSGAAGTNSTCQ